MSVEVEIMGKKIGFAVDERGKIAPQSARDEEILIEAWNINDDILSEFVAFLNETMSDNAEKIALLTNTAECVFADSEEIYYAGYYKAGGQDATQGEIEKAIDEIYDNALFGYEGVFLVKKSELG